MPEREFYVTVEVDADDSSVAVAEASKYLAYADTTDTFGYWDTGIQAVSSFETEDSFLITIAFCAIIENDSAKERLMDEMDTLEGVCSFTER